MNRKQLEEVLEGLDSHLKEKTHLRIIGGAAMLMLGSERATRDIDIHLDQSSFSPQDLRAACDFAKVAYNPEYADESQIYLEIVPESQYLDLPKKGTNPDNTLWQGKNLKVTCPPPQDMLVSKIKRFDVRDIQDISFLAGLIPTKDRIPACEEAVKRLPGHTTKDIVFRENLADLKKYYLPNIEELRRPQSGPQPSI